MDQYDKRNYRRASHFLGELQVSADGENWQNAQMKDISSSGMQMQSGIDYEDGENLWVDVLLSGYLSEFRIKARGTICRKKVKNSHYSYGVKFENLPIDLHIRLDENVSGDRPVGKGYYISE